MRAFRPLSYWAVVAAVIVLPLLAVRTGLGVFRAIERAPHQISSPHSLAVAAGRAHRRVELWWLFTSGVVVAVALVLVELAYRRRRRLAAAAREMDLLQSALPFALLSLDRDGRIRHASGYVHRTLGLSRPLSGGERLADLLTEVDRPVLRAALQGAARGTPRQCEAVTSGAGGHPHALTMLLSPIVEQGEVRRIAAVVHDVSGERALKAQVLQSERLASVGTLVASVVHEMNNPLAAIAAFAELIDRTALSADDRAAVDTIAAEARRAAQIARNVLDFSRERATRHGPVDIGTVIRRAAALRGYELRRRAVTLELNLPEDLPYVNGDAQQFQQVALNLLVNAEHAVAGRATKRIVVGAASNGGRLTVAVEDSGPGVPPNQRERIFEPFFTTKSEGEGTGLGLALCRGIASEHGGTLTVHDAALGGARLVLDLPAIPRTALAEAPERVTMNPGSLAVDEASPTLGGSP
jgi:two-component system NtrC family sensor kinase